MDIATDIADKLRNAGIHSKSEQEAALVVQEQLARLPPHRRGPVAMRVKAMLDRDVREAQDRSALTRHVVETVKEFSDWWSGTFVLEKNECSRLHKLIEASQRQLVYGWNEKNEFRPVPDLLEFAGIQVHCFVIRHNWAAALNGTEATAGDFSTPYDKCAFEFKYSGRPVIALWNQQDELRSIAFAEFGDLWIVLGSANKPVGLLSDLIAQIRAISVSLDAEVATHEVVRAPAALNEKRAKAGKPLLSDFHVVDLAKRHRIANPVNGSSEPAHQKRLHFVRGHWRHYETSKTWIRWHLRGNPDLGFIAKHYSL